MNQIMPSYYVTAIATDTNSRPLKGQEGADVAMIRLWHYCIRMTLHLPLNRTADLSCNQYKASFCTMWPAPAHQLSAGPVTIHRVQDVSGWIQDIFERRVYTSVSP